MKQIIKKLMIISLFIVCTVTATTASAYPAQGTEGDELQVAEAQHLEIQLGTEWTGVEFMLKTDAGIYPDLIPVDETGVLSFEIGGSKSYILSCMQSSAPIPELIMQAPVTIDAETIAEESIKSIEEESNVSGIPITHIVMFGAGILIAIGILVAIHISNKNKQTVQNDEEDDDF